MQPQRVTEGGDVWCVTRKVGEALVLPLPDGTLVRVAVVDVGRKNGEVAAKIGVDAPREVPVHRYEVAVRRAEENTPEHDAPA